MDENPYQSPQDAQSSPRPRRPPLHRIARALRICYTIVWAFPIIVLFLMILGICIKSVVDLFRQPGGFF